MFNIEHDAQVRSLPPVQRLLYHVLLALALSGLFLLTVALAVALATLLVRLLLGLILTPEDLLTLGLPILLAFMLSIGLSVLRPVPNEVRVTAAWRAARAGIFGGLVTGFFFGAIWAIAFRIDAMYWEDWRRVFESGLLVYGLIVGLAVAPTFALFRGLSVLAPEPALRFAQRARADQNA